VNVEVTGESLGWPRNPDTDRLAAIWLAEAEKLRLPVGTEQRGGLSDGNMLWDAVPTLDGLGPWGDHAHCSERSADGTKVPEYVEVSSFVTKAALNVHAILALLSESAVP
jgi:glutamate carboxypeptidase